MAGEKTGTGLEPNVAGLLCYVLIWVTGLIFYLIEKENRFVRFHAMQSIIVFGTLTVASLILGVIPIIGWVISWLLGIAALVLWILLFKVPIAGNIAEKHI